MRALSAAICRKDVDAVAIPEYITTEGEREQAEKIAEAVCAGSKEAADPNSYEMKGRLVWEMENRCTVQDMLGICKLYDVFHIGNSLELGGKLFPLITGRDVSKSDLLIAAPASPHFGEGVCIHEGNTAER